MNKESYDKVMNNLNEALKIIRKAANHNERMYPDQYQPLKQKMSELKSEVSSISEF